MLYGYHKALCLQRLKGDVFMDCRFLLHYLHSLETNLPFFSPLQSGGNKRWHTMVQFDQNKTVLR